MRPIRQFATLLACFALATGCADVARWVRQYTYPPDFHYIERDQLRSAMWQLARHVRELDRELRASPGGEARPKEILLHLEGMEKATRSLDISGWPSNHPMVDMNIAKFRQDIQLARESAERTPPNYVFAQALPGACLYCHSGRQRTPTSQPVDKLSASKSPIGPMQLEPFPRSVEATERRIADYSGNGG
jgi:hypothetical protein